MEIWHNPRCGKSRAAKQALDEAGIEYVERRYLDDAPTSDELSKVLDLLGQEPWEITRMGEARAKELGLASAPRDRATWIRLLAENPMLVERPILVDGDRAAVGRTAEAVEEITRRR
jgi:arsenate reductase